MAENYRPISVLSLISKVMERMMYHKLYEYVNENSLLDDHQFGFRRFHSTASALLDCTNDWHMNMDRKMLYFIVLF